MDEQQKPKVRRTCRTEADDHAGSVETVRLEDGRWVLSIKCNSLPPMTVTVDITQTVGQAIELEYRDRSPLWQKAARFAEQTRAMNPHLFPPDDPVALANAPPLEVPSARAAMRHVIDGLRSLTGEEVVQLGELLQKFKT